MWRVVDVVVGPLEKIRRDAVNARETLSAAVVGVIAVSVCSFLPLDSTFFLTVTA
jgi:hypothetical protein